MKNQKLKLDDINVESLNSFELIKNEDLSMFAGGSGSGTYSWDCFFNCFDYLDKWRNGWLHERVKFVLLEYSL